MRHSIESFPIAAARGRVLRIVNIMENIESGGLLPRFTLRWFSICFTLSVLIAWILRQAVMGSQWAQAAVATLVAMAGLFAIYAVLFLTIWIPTAVANLGSSSGQRNSVVTPSDDQEASA